ncbi:MAG TPA: lysophospholipid acyltransferase family protein [Thermodesulfobacteriota bacterium]|nr:lysophospholipid acyltransferase family protein [Thermodesulfobacteriota bacterium]
MSQRLKLKDKLILILAPTLAKIIIKALAFTMKLEFLYEERVRPFWEKDERFIAAFWHNRLLLMGYSYHGKGIKILISQHKDGELIARVLKHLGFSSIRGSSTRGGAAAMREMVRASREYDIGITPDGPRGPKYMVQEGVIALARLTGKPILPLTFGSSKKKVFASWDAFNLPYPFSRGVFMWGEPIYVSKEDDIEEKRKELEGKLREMTEFVDEYVKKEK